MASKSEGEDAGEVKKGLPLIKIAILGVIVLALGAGGYVGWIKFFKNPASETTHKIETEKKIIHDWESFLVNLADANGKRYLKLAMKLELSGTKLQEELAQRNFEMRDSIIMVLSGKEFEDISTPPGKTRLKQEIMNRLNKIMKSGQVKEIYFTEFIVQ